MSELLAGILENEDLESLKWFDLEKLGALDKEIVQFILDENTFSSQSIMTHLSKDHAVRYMELCNLKAKENIDKEIDIHLAKIEQNVGDT